MNRCLWSQSNAFLTHYHDTEWGVPVHDDQKLFEYIVLDSFQAGLSWSIILVKREHFRRALDNFDPQKIAKYDEEKIESLLLNKNIVRNALKITATITNARAFLNIQKEFGSFDNYIWQFVSGKTKVNKWDTHSNVPSTSFESDRMSSDMRKRGFKFVGSTTCYAFMQASGMINDHTTDCFRYNEILNLAIV